MQLVFHHYSATEANNMCKGGRLLPTFDDRFFAGFACWCPWMGLTVAHHRQIVIAGQ
jgi:hypothetical protein